MMNQLLISSLSEEQLQTVESFLERENIEYELPPDNKAYVAFPSQGFDREIALKEELTRLFEERFFDVMYKFFTVMNFHLRDNNQPIPRFFDLSYEMDFYKGVDWYISGINFYDKNKEEITDPITLRPKHRVGVSFFQEPFIRDEEAEAVTLEEILKRELEYYFSVAELRRVYEDYYLISIP